MVGKIATMKAIPYQTLIRQWLAEGIRKGFRLGHRQHPRLHRTFRSAEEATRLFVSRQMRDQAVFLVSR